MKLIQKMTIIFALIFISIGNIFAQSGIAEGKEPFIVGGVYDKPYMFRIGQMSMSGYADFQFRFERADGIMEEMTFLAKRFNLFTFAPVSDRVRVASEIEFEEGGEEIALELAIIDFEIHEAFTFRGGVILSPLGRFNLSHDSPVNPMIDRPLVSTGIIPTTLSETGMGFYGAIYPTATTRVTYELYGVNGLTDAVISSSEGGTRISNGKHNFEDNNNHPSLTGRVTISPLPKLEIGLSTHTGPYNNYDAEGIELDEKRNLSIFALDGEYSFSRYAINGEFAWANIDVYPHLRGIYAEKQWGFYFDASVKFMEGSIPQLPASSFVGVFRFDHVDFDSDIDGDSENQITLGINFKPAADTVFKLNYLRSWQHDRFNVEAEAAAILFGVATYF